MNGHLGYHLLTNINKAPMHLNISFCVDTCFSCLYSFGKIPIRPLSFLIDSEQIEWKKESTDKNQSNPFIG